MKVAGQAVLHAPVERVWEALLDPATLVATIPGCESLETTAENTYAMTVTAGVAAIKGTYAGTCALGDLARHESLRMRAEGSGGPGTVAADVQVRFEDLGDGTTRIDYDADAVVGGMIGGVGQRMLTSVGKRLAGEFFGNVDAALTGSGASGPASSDPDGAAVASADRKTFTAPTRAGAPTGAGGFPEGALVGGGLVLAGVVVGAVLGRRR